MTSKMPTADTPDGLVDVEAAHITIRATCSWISETRDFASSYRRTRRT